MTILLNSGHVLVEDAPVCLLIFAAIAWGMLLTLAILRKLDRDQPLGAPHAALALAGWPMPLLLISMLFLAFRLLLGETAAGILTILAAAASSVPTLLVLRGGVARDAALPPALFGLLVLVRLGYAEGILLPPYFDSAEHYRIIGSLLALRPRGEIVWPAASYYHLGYHMIAAALTELSGGSLARVMLILGQVILACLPLPVYFLVHRVTGSTRAALVGVALAALGWSMPAHAVNWGKYPALLSLLLVQFALAAALLRHGHLLAASMAGAVLVHTRALVLFPALASGWLAVHVRRPLVIALGACLAAVVGLLLLRSRVPEELAVTYAVWPTLLAALLALQAPADLRRDVVSALLGAAAMLGALFIPVTPALSLLDRPLVHMSLYLPLAFAGGVGAAGLRKWASTLILAALVIHGLSTYRFTPSTCCQLAGPDDVVALDWIGKNLPPGARVGIAAADITLIPDGPPLRSTGADAGIWLEPLTGRRPVALSRFTDFTDGAVHQDLCGRRIGYLYIGGRPESFQSGAWIGLPNWYEVIFALPGAQIVRVTGC